MTRITPSSQFLEKPCSYVALNCAIQARNKSAPLTEMPARLRASDGYLTLAGCNKYIRSHLPVKKRVDYKRGERPKLKDLSLDGSAIVVVLGHCIYVEGDTYYSFFDNENDDVVSLWLLK